MANKFNISQLLNSASKGVPGEEKNRLESNRPLKIIQISVYDLVPSKDNFYSMEQIEELKIAIELAGGVKQNLNVTKLENGKYKIIAGHRRQLASLSLTEEGKKQYEFLPCSIETKEEDTELNEIKEELLLILTNSQRDKTDWDKIEETKRLKAILERYKKKEKLPGRIREIIAQILSTSPTQIGRMDAISNNLTLDFQEELKEEKINMSTAYELSGLSEEDQIEVFEEYKEKGNLTIKDVKQKKEDIAAEIDKISNEVDKKLNKEYEDLSDKYKKIEVGAVDLIEEEVKVAIPDNTREMDGIKNDTEIETESNWVPVSERLPNDIECNQFGDRHPSYRRFLCTIKIEDYQPQTRILFLSDTLSWKSDGGNYDKYVTAWQPIPDPYKGEEGRI